MIMVTGVRHSTSDSVGFGRSGIGPACRARIGVPPETGNTLQAVAEGSSGTPNPRCSMWYTASSRSIATWLS
jgi:hypothetical protein